MYYKYIQKLEFNKVLDILSNYCTTNLAKEYAKSLMPEAKKDKVYTLLRQTSEATSLINKKTSPSFLQISDISNMIKILESNSILSIKDLLEINKILNLSANLKNYYFTDNENSLANFPILEELFSALYTNPSICKILRKFYSR